MAVRYRSDRNKWQAQITTETGRISRHFDTEREATEWEAAARAQHSRQRQQVEPQPALQDGGSIGNLVRICSRLDWAGKDPAQMENAARLARMLGPQTHARELTMGRLDDLVADLRRQGLGNTTIKKYLSAISVMLKRACRLGFIEAMPLMPEKRTLRSPEPRDLVIRDEWMAALLAAMEKREQRLSIALTLFLRQTGCRVGEALTLTWDRVDLEARSVQFVRTKGAMPRRIPADDQVMGVLRAMKARGAELVFPTSYACYKRHYSEAKHDACDALGLGDGVRREWVIHALRHTRITELASQGHQAPAIQQWAGHKSLSVTQRYIHGAAINLETLLQS